MKFVCDDNLGKLARYMRTLGFDTAHENDISNSRLIQISLDDNRTILTRDTRLIKLTLVRDYLLISSNLWPEQLREVIRNYHLEIDNNSLFSRCLENNIPIIPVHKPDIKAFVYPYIYAHHDNFRQCPICKRIYWHGSHEKVMTHLLKKHGFIN